MATHSAPSCKTRWSVLIAAATWLAVCNVQAGYTINSTVGPFTDSLGNDLNHGSLVVVVVDLGRDGIALPTATDFAPGADDQVFGIAATSNITGVGSVVFGAFSDNTLSVGSSTAANVAIDAGDPFAMFWYPDLTHQQFLTDTSVDPPLWDVSSGPGNSSYGSYNVDGADSDWVFPSDGNTEDVRLLPVSSGGTIPDAQVANLFRASSAIGPAVPEPSSAVLLLAASGLFVFRRKRD